MEKIEQIIFYTLDKSIKTYRQLAQARLAQAGLGITVDQWLVMNVISEKPRASQQEIAQKVFKDGASVTRIIELLVKKGFLKRDAAAGDRRKSQLVISLKGKRLLVSAGRVVASYRKKALRDISVKDLEKVRSVLARITENCA